MDAVIRYAAQAALPRRGVSLRGAGRPLLTAARDGRERGTPARVGYRYWPVLLAVSIERPDSGPLPETSVRM